MKGVLRATTANFRRWIAAIMVVVLIVSLTVWWYGRESLPGSITIAAGKADGLYYALSQGVQQPMQARLGSTILVKETQGSIENLRMLLDGDADLAIVQGGAVEMDEVSIVTPLFPEYLLVLARADGGIDHVSDLAGRSVALGEPKSGSRESALHVLEYFGIDVGKLGMTDADYHAFAQDRAIDAAIVAAGIRHPGLFEMLGSGEFRLLPVETSAAVEMRSPFYYRTVIPQGLFAPPPAPIPDKDVPTVATTAFLVARKADDVPAQVITAALEAIHEESLRLEIHSLIPRAEAMERVPTKLHPVAYRYFNPTDDIGHLAAVMESLAATKELMFALGAGLYLLWLRWRQLKDRETNEALRRQKDRLDRFLNQTLQIEHAQTKTDDVAKLREFLDQVTEIKLRALQELTEEELRGDQAFAIFLAQCANLINKMQFKILNQKQGADDAASHLTGPE